MALHCFGNGQAETKDLPISSLLTLFEINKLWSPYQEDFYFET